MPVLSERVDNLERRVGELEEENEKREDSNAGIRRELAAHQLEDAKALAELKGALATVSARVGMMRWLLGIIIALGIINGVVTFATHESPAKTARP